jgi:periplasmic protein TonB
MIAQPEELKKEMSAERPSTMVVNQPDDNLNLLVPANDTPWFKSFVANIKDVIQPKKLPPLEVTSKPVPVKDIWGDSKNTAKATTTSMMIHVTGIALLLFLGTNKHVQQTVKESVSLIAPDIAPYIAAAPKKQVMGGGGGGGDRSPTPASKGKLPKIAPRQFAPPSAVINNPNPKLMVEPTIVVQPNAPLPQVNSVNLGDPLRGVAGPPSNGTGSGGGIGSGSGGGVGSGSGVGVGPGSGAGYGGGVYKIGGGVSAPVPVFKPEPEYSEEARKAKYQGSVTLSIVIMPDGSTSNIRVVRPLGLGLDEKAIEAVTKWRFRPSLKDGKPVAVTANVEVNFRLL